MASKGQRSPETNISRNTKILERLKKKLKLRLGERDSMSERYKLLIQEKENLSPRTTTKSAQNLVDKEYQDLTRRINRIRAEILAIEGGVITDNTIDYVKRNQFGLKDNYTMNGGANYKYKVGDMYFNDRLNENELKIIEKQPNLPLSKQNLGDTAEGGEMSQEMEDRALHSNFYQQLQIKNSNSKLDKRTVDNGTF